MKNMKNINGNVINLVKKGKKMDFSIKTIRQFFLLINCLWGLLPTKALGSTCSDVITQIASDIRTSPARGGTVIEVPLVWKNLSWLQGRLGQSTPNTVFEDLYQWEGYSLMIRDGKVTQALGTLPNTGFEDRAINELPSVTDVMNVLGPAKQHFTAKMSEYVWTCPDNGAQLTVLADAGGNVVEVRGRSCATNDPLCNEFSTNLGKSELMRKEDVQMVQTGEARRDIIQENMMKQYNANFMAGVQDSTALNNDMIKRLQTFYNALRICQPGIYRYAVSSGSDPNMMFYTAIIQAKSSGTCPVEISYNLPGTGKAVSECQFQMESLPLFTDQAAFAVGGVGNADEASLQIEKVMKTQCEISINEEKIED